jgi:hypothetical protein
VHNKTPIQNFVFFILQYFLSLPVTLFQPEFFYRTKGRHCCSSIYWSTPQSTVTPLSLPFLSRFVCYLYLSLIPTYRYSISSTMSFDLNNELDHNHHHLFNSNIHQPSYSYSILFNQNQDQGRSYSLESNHIQSDHLEVYIAHISYIKKNMLQPFLFYLVIIIQFFFL